MSTLIEKLEKRLKKIQKSLKNGVDSDQIIALHSHESGFLTAFNIVKKHSDWISVDERLPDSDCYVIVYCDGGNVTKSFFTTNREYLRLSRNSRYTRKAYGKNSGYFAISHDDGYKVTHWQPLPNPPSEVQS